MEGGVGEHWLVKIKEDRSAVFDAAAISQIRFLLNAEFDKTVGPQQVDIRIGQQNILKSKAQNSTLQQGKCHRVARYFYPDRGRLQMLRKLSTLYRYLPR